jgi:CRP-like cAMP-binding protein
MVHSPPAPPPLVPRSPAPCDACAPEELACFVASDATLAKRFGELPRRRFGVGQSLLRIGDLADKLWLIERGLVRMVFVSAQGIERNKSFHAEGAWIGGGLPPVPAPSAYAIEALEPVEVVELSFAELARCLQDFPAVQPVLMGALSWTFSRQSAREEQLLMQDAAQRYRSFLDDNADLAARLPLHHVASHLGITNVALSRIRQRLGMGDARKGRRDS